MHHSSEYALKVIIPLMIALEKKKVNNIPCPG